MKGCGNIWYLGGKIRLSKHISPIIESYIDNNQQFIDLFCGGCNIIDKISNTSDKTANDSHKNLIDMWCNISKIDISKMDISKEHYTDVKNNRDRHESWYIGLVGFHYSYGGKFFGGFARSRYEDHIERSINKTIKQYENLRDVDFTCFDYRHYSDVKNAVIYCDPPYDNSTQDSTKYNVKFDYKEFWGWCRYMSKNNTVIVSEKTAPNDFDIIWEKEHNSNMSYTKSDKTTEKLWIYKI